MSTHGLFELMKLPYDFDALTPHVSARTVEVHYTQHHASYVSKLNDAVAKSTSAKDMTLRELVINSHNKPEMIDIYNNSSQIVNHDLYWLTLGDGGNVAPSRELVSLIEKSGYSSVSALLEEWKTVAVSQFASGWAWIVLDQFKKIRVKKTSNADNPIIHGCLPLLCLDVWEHAYYLDCESNRKKYCESFMQKVNWKLAMQMMEHGWYSSN